MLTNGSNTSGVFDNKAVDCLAALLEDKLAIFDLQLFKSTFAPLVIYNAGAMGSFSFREKSSPFQRNVF